MSAYYKIFEDRGQSACIQVDIDPNTLNIFDQKNGHSLIKETGWNFQVPISKIFVFIQQRTDLFTIDDSN